NFIRGRWRNKQLTYLGIDLGFMALVAFISIFVLSIIFSWSSEEDMKVENYIQKQITKLNSQVAEYAAVKTQRDKLL
ncbi:type IV pili associated protein, partial [Francisella tularensis subsp. holarctica]|nr:type IV pili associated protein [Francisella tularensis subsp. holarctica]